MPEPTQFTAVVSLVVECCKVGDALFKFSWALKLQWLRRVDRPGTRCQHQDTKVDLEHEDNEKHNVAVLVQLIGHSS